MIVRESPQEAARRKALEQARHELWLAGLQTSAFAEALFERLIRGELSADEVRKLLVAHYTQ